MLRQGAIVIASLVFASSVLFTSIFRTASPQYVFSQAGQVESATTEWGEDVIDYYLPYPGVLPDHFLWPIKALRDKLWLLVVRDSGKRAEVLLLFADKRVGMARELVRGGKPELGVSTATKAEKYLEQALAEAEKAQAKGTSMDAFYERIAKSSLKHEEVLSALMKISSEDARPVLNKTLGYPKGVYEKATHKLNELGRPVPVVPEPTPPPVGGPSPTPKSSNKVAR